MLCWLHNPGKQKEKARREPSQRPLRSGGRGGDGAGHYRSAEATQLGAGAVLGQHIGPLLVSGNMLQDDELARVEVAEQVRAMVDVLRAVVVAVRTGELDAVVGGRVAPFLAC